jgi:DNA-binding winged helix-turn-helix (wHTH) protein/Flp pilus assembly protein TadD
MGRIVPLTVKAADTLTVLVQHAGTVVTKEELIAAVWPDTVVEENNLNQQISLLRRVLPRNNGPLIETVPRRGYRFVLDVRTVPLSVLAPEPAADVPEGNTGATSGVTKRTLGSLMSGTARQKRSWVAAVLIGLFGAGTLWLQQPDAAVRASDAARVLADQHRSRGDHRTAIAEYERAITIDPRNAMAYGGLAHALHNLSYQDSVRRPAGGSPSVAAARRSVELDPSCAPCRGTLGLYLFYHDWEWSEAESHLREAIRQAPEKEGIRPSYAMLLAATGRLDDALREIDFAISRRPHRSSWRVLRATVLYLQRRYPEALAATDQALQINDDDRDAWEWRSRALFQLGRGEEAVEALAKVAFADHAEQLEAAVTEGGGPLGLQMLLQLTGGWHRRVEQSWRRAPWRALLRDRDGALDELERAYEYRNLNLVYLASDPVYDDLRNEPRFRRILAGMGLSVALQNENPLTH